MYSNFQNGLGIKIQLVKTSLSLMPVPIWWIICMYWVQGWGLLSRFPLFRYFHIAKIHFSYWILCSYLTGASLCCVDTCQIWTSFKECNRYFCEIENFAYGEIDESSFSYPTPGPMEGWPSVIIGQNGFGRRNTGNTDTPIINPLGPGECLLSEKNEVNCIWKVI